MGSGGGSGGSGCGGGGGGSSGALQIFLPIFEVLKDEPLFLRQLVQIPFVFFVFVRLPSEGPEGTTWVGEGKWG